MRIVLLLALTACNGPVETDTDTDADTDADTDSDTDSDTDADTDSDTDADTDSDTDTDTDSDTDVSEEHPRIWVVDDVRTRLEDDLAAPTDAAERFRARVDAQVAGADYYAFSPADVALMYVLTGDESYADFAVAAMDAEVASEEALIAAGQRAEVAADSYLYVGPRIGDLALVYDWCHDQLTADQRDRWRAYANQAVSNVWDPEGAEWGGVSYPWSGWGTADPMNNYHYSFLRATMLLGLATLGEDDASEGWLDLFREEKLPILLDAFDELEGGGSAEGTGYGIALRELFTLYVIWEASTGEDLAALTPHTHATLPFMLHAIVPTADRIAPVGDHARDSSGALFDYHREELLILGTIVGDDPLTEATRTFLADCSVTEMSQPFMASAELLHDLGDTPAAPLDTLHTAYHAPGTGNVFARSDWDADAVWMHAIAGPYTQSHAHRDQGSFLLYAGEWLAWDENVATHSGIDQREEVHNLVRFDDDGTTVRQVEGNAGEVVGLVDEPAWLWVGMDTVGVYTDSRVTTSSRDVVFFREGALVVFDRAEASGDVEPVWQLNTPDEPSLASGGASWSTGLELTVLAPSSPSSSAYDYSDEADVVGGGWRLELRGEGPFLTVLSAGGAVTEAVAVDDTGRTGVALTLASGAEATVWLDDDAPGGSVTYEGDTTDLDGVEELPILAE